MPIAKTIARKMDSYGRIVCSDFARLVRNFDHRFPNNIIPESDLIRKNISVPWSEKPSVELVASTSLFYCSTNNHSQNSVVEQLFEDKAPIYMMGMRLEIL